MRRASTLMTLILASSLNAIIEANDVGMEGEVQPWLTLARQRNSTKLTTKMPLPNKTTLIEPTMGANIDKTDRRQKQQIRKQKQELQPQLQLEQEQDSKYRKPRQFDFYHPAFVQKPRLIERYDKRALDGHYEFRYVLSNGDVRYERAYWQPVGNSKVLARKGFYSYPLLNHHFHTVFYTADHNGFREENSSYSRTQPALPDSLEVPISEVSLATPSPSSTIEEKENKINRKSNWNKTKTILQRGNFQAIHQIANAKRQHNTITAKSTQTINTNATEVKVKDYTRRNTANRPQINIEVAVEPLATTNSVQIREQHGSGGGRGGGGGRDRDRVGVGVQHQQQLALRQ